MPPCIRPAALPEAGLSGQAGVRLARATLLVALLLLPLVHLPLRAPLALLPDRLLNLALHGVVSLLLFAVSRCLGASGLIAPAAALLFAVHPAHVPAVALVAARAEPLSAALSLTAVLALLRPAGRGGRLTPLVAVPSLWLALETSVTGWASVLLVPAAAWLQGLPSQAGEATVLQRRRQAWLTVVLASTGFLAMRLAGFAPASAARWTAAEPVDLAGALARVARAFGGLLYPVDLHPAVPHATDVVRDLFDPLALVGLAVVVLLASLALRPFTTKRAGPMARLASLASLLFILPYSVQACLGSPRQGTAADAALYLPVAGFCLLLGLAIGGVSTGWPRVPGREVTVAPGETARHLRLAAFALAALLAAFSILTWARCQAWTAPVSPPPPAQGRLQERGSPGTMSLPLFEATR